MSDMLADVQPERLGTFGRPRNRPSQFLLRNTRSRAEYEAALPSLGKLFTERTGLLGA